MTDHQRYINALRKCAKEHENDRTFTGHIIVSDLCRDTANLLESLQSNSDGDCISRKDAEMCLTANITNMTIEEYISMVGDRLKGLPSVQPKPIEGDAISRAEMLEVIHECEKHFEPTWKWKEMLSKLPSIQPKPKTGVLDKIRAEIEQVRTIMDEEIENHDRKDLINFVNGLNQSLMIIDKYKAEKE